jgi:putative glutamine amidotransferase
MSVPTWHHQSVLQPGTGLNVTSHTADGIIEAVECTGDRFILGVQWHPEHALDDHLCLFQEFVARAAAPANERSETVAASMHRD